MLPHYSPLKVAETFSMLARARAGADRSRAGPRGRHRSAHHLRAAARSASGRARTTFRSSSWSCSAYLDHTLPADHPFARLRPLPGAAERPEPWLLGSSPQSGIWAAELGLPYAFADFINPAGDAIMSRYPAAFAAARPRRTPAARSGGGVGARAPRRTPRPAARGQRAHGASRFPARRVDRRCRRSRPRSSSSRARSTIRSPSSAGAATIVGMPGDGRAADPRCGPATTAWTRSWS